MLKKVTIEDLARMVKGGFDGNTAQFGEVNERLNQIDLRLGHMDARLAMVERDIADIRKHFVYRDEFEDALARIALLEKKAGVKSGK